MTKTAKPIGAKALNEESLRKKYADRVRHGKTARDHSKRATKGTTSESR